MKKIVALTILCSVSAVFILSVPALLHAGEGRLPVKGSGNTTLNGNTADGTGTITIGKKTYEVYIHVEVISMVEKGKSLHATTTHTFRTGSETGPVLFSTEDKEVLAPTKAPGEYILNGNSQVAEGGIGHLTVHGTLDMNTGQVSYEMHGAMRLIEESQD